MKVSVNGEDKHLGAGATVSDVVRLLGGPDAVRGVAVALNGEVVPRMQWPAVILEEEDRIEVLRAVGGGSC